jgi:hypothetical protein
MPEVPDRYQDCVIGGFDLRFTLSGADLLLSYQILYAIDFCKPVEWNGNGINRDPATAEDFVQGQPPLGFVVPGDVPFAIAESNARAASFFAGGLGYLYAAYATSPVYRVIVTRENATVVDPPAIVTCNLFRYTCRT